MWCVPHASLAAPFSRRRVTKLRGYSFSTGLMMASLLDRSTVYKYQRRKDSHGNRWLSSTHPAKRHHVMDIGTFPAKQFGLPSPQHSAGVWEHRTGIARSQVQIPLKS